MRGAARRGLRRVAVRCAGAFAACARACRAVMPRCCRASRSCECAAACGIVQSVVSLMVHFGAMWGCCGLCGASRACAMVKP